MNVDEIITLDDNKSYLLLLCSDIKEDDFYLAVLLDENENPTTDYVVLKEIEDGDDLYYQEINDASLLADLLEDYMSQIEEDII